MQINQLRAFVAVVAEGGVSAAARALGMAQPTLTRALQQLESEMGAVVLARGPSGTVPTPFGRQLLPHAQRILRSHEKAEQTGRQLAGDRAHAGDVHLAASAVARATLLPAAMRFMWSAFPGVRITLAEPTFPGLLQSFDSDAIDIAVCSVRDNLPEEGYRCEPLLSVPLVVAMRRHHPRARFAGLDELHGCMWIASGQAGDTGLAGSFALHGLSPPDCPAHFESVESSLSAVASTDMIALAPEPLVQRGFEDGLFEAPRLSGTLSRLELSLVVRDARVPTPAAARLSEGLRQAATGLIR